MEARAKLSYARISSRKVKIVIDLIRNKPVAEALGILKNTPKAASEILVKLLESAIANAEGEQQSAILKAQGLAKARILQAEAEAEAIRRTVAAIEGHGDPDKYLIAVRYLDTLKKMVEGNENKVVYMPYEATGILSSVDGIKQMFSAEK